MPLLSSKRCHVCCCCADQSPKLCGETASRIALVAAADRQAESQEPHQEPKAIERGEFGVILKLGVISFAGTMQFCDIPTILISQIG